MVLGRGSCYSYQTTHKINHSIRYLTEMEVYSSDLDDTLGNKLIQRFGCSNCRNCHISPRVWRLTRDDDESDVDQDKSHGCCTQCGCIALHISGFDD